jgi:HEAT repeat protein
MAGLRKGVRFPGLPSVRAQSIEAAAEIPGEDIALLIREGLGDEQAGVRFAACMALGRRTDASTAGAVRKLLGDPDPSVRVGVYFALERVGDPSNRQTWVEILRQAERPSVRRNAVLALGQLEDKATLPLLKLAAETDDDEGVRLQAMEAVAVLGDRDAINRFIHDAFGGAGFRQVFALLTLGRVGDPRVLPTLRARLAHAPYVEARLAAARALAMNGYDAGYDLAVQCLAWNEPDPAIPDDPPQTQVMRVRSMAALVLGDLGDRRALGWLKQQLERSNDPRVQLAAVTAILKILEQSPDSKLPPPK